jgi:hypothetical protein
MVVVKVKLENEQNKRSRKRPSSNKHLSILSLSDASRLRWLSDELFCQVFLGGDIGTDERYVLTLRSRIAPGHGQKQALRELECLAVCSHPLLLRLIGFYLEPSLEVSLGIATEFYPNETLQPALEGKRQGRQPVLTATQNMENRLGKKVNNLS